MAGKQSPHQSPERHQTSPADMASAVRGENPSPPEQGVDLFPDHRGTRSSNSTSPSFTASSSPPSSASSTTTQHSPLPSSSSEGTSSSPAAPRSTANATAATTEPPPLTSIRVAAANNPEPLPLGWTQVQRKRKRSIENDATDPQFCCEDPDCVRPDGPSIPSSDDAANAESRSVANFTTLRGKAIFCLPTLSATWYQGHFLPSTASPPKPLGILAIERDNVDECLRCNDGGYKELDVQVFNYVDGKRLTQRIEGPVVGTGGDMMRLRSSSSAERKVGMGGRNGTTRIEYDADKILTGKRAAPFVRRYFSNLLNKVRGSSSSERCETEEGSDVVELLPDVAIVVGTMKLTVPAKFLVVGLDKKNDNDDDDGLWG